MTVKTTAPARRIKKPAAGQSDADQRTVPVTLSPHQAMLLDEWISDHSAPKPNRSEALLLHFDWSIARCSSRLDKFPRTREPDFTTGKDVL